MKLIPQGSKLYAVAVEYVRGTEAGSEDETAVSFGTVVAWQTDPELDDDAPRAILVPVIAWFHGQASQGADGAVGVPSLSLDPITSAVMFGGALADAAKSTDMIVAERLPAWRRGYKTIGTYAAAKGGTDGLDLTVRKIRPTVTIEPPDDATVLAARHLDQTEGPVQTGGVVDTATRAAINTVLRYVAEAYNAPRGAGR